MLHCSHSVLACANDALHLSVKLSSDVYRLTGLRIVPNEYTGKGWQFTCCLRQFLVFSGRAWRLLLPTTQQA